MNAFELRDLLDQQIQDGQGLLDVVFVHGSGDYWGTQVAPPVAGLTLGRVTHSGYHDCDRVAPDCRDDDEDPRRGQETPGRAVIMLE